MEYHFQFNEKDLQVFSQASYDTNPLHLDEIYASRSSFGSRVVFGIAILAKAFSFYLSTKKRNIYLLKLKCEFKKAVLICEKIKFQITESKKVSINVFNKTFQSVAKFEFEYTYDDINSGCISALEIINNTGQNFIYEKQFQPRDIKNFYSYFPFFDKLNKLQATFLLWTSKFVGTEYPGKQALFFSLNVDFENSKKSNCLVLRKIEKDERFSLIKILCNWKNDKNSKIQIIAMNRPEPVYTSIDLFKTRHPILKGLNVFITGGSRGLGAALSKCFAANFSNVDISYNKNKSSAELVVKEIKTKKVQSDLYFANFIEKDAHEILVNNINKRYDIIVLNAMSQIDKINFLDYEPTDFLTRYSEDFQLLYNSVLFALKSLKENGKLVYISSIFTEEPKVGFTKYIAVKSSIESLLFGLSKELKKINFYSMKVPRILTDQTNNPLFTTNMHSVSDVSEKLISYLVRNMSSDLSFQEIHFK